MNQKGTVLTQVGLLTGLRSIAVPAAGPDTICETGTAACQGKSLRSPVPPWRVEEGALLLHRVASVSQAGAVNHTVQRGKWRPCVVLEAPNEKAFLLAKRSRLKQKINSLMPS